MSQEGQVFLTVRGKHRARDLEGARKLHNEIAGSPQAIAAARALSDLTHSVFVPLEDSPTSPPANELLFLDVWEDTKGIAEFFSSKDVQKGGEALFSGRDATVWMPAAGAFGFQLSAPSRRTDRLVGLVRGPIGSPEKAIEIFRNETRKRVRDARRLGQISHQLYVKLAPPGDRGPLELLGVDVWFDAKGMGEHYQALDMGALAPAFAGAPDATVWRAAPGEWAEW